METGSGATGQPNNLDDGVPFIGQSQTFAKQIMWGINEGFPKES